MRFKVRKAVSRFLRDSIGGLSFPKEGTLNDVLDPQEKVIFFPFDPTNEHCCSLGWIEEKEMSRVSHSW